MNLKADNRQDGRRHCGLRRARTVYGIHDSDNDIWPIDQSDHRRAFGAVCRMALVGTITTRPNRSSRLIGPIRIFWFLLILAGTTFVPFVLFLPETCRHVVDNGSFLPPWPCINITDARRYKARLANGESVDHEKFDQFRRNYKLALPRPRKTLSVLTDRTSALLLTTSSLGTISRTHIMYE